MNECAFLEASLEIVPCMSCYNVASLQCVEEDMEREKRETRHDRISGPGPDCCLLTHGELKPAVVPNTNIPQNISLYSLFTQPHPVGNR
jgi:hypothetical protein